MDRQNHHCYGPRPDDWGKRSRHPLWQRWKTIRRRNGGGVSPEWDDFWRYVADVGGARPKDEYRLFRPDPSRPWGPDNFEWRTVDGCRDRNAYMREWRQKNMASVREKDMLKRSGMNLAEYDALLEAQECGCAICGELDPHFRLAVDHDHETGQNRGLLCAKCNRGLGLFGDSPARLDIAAAYIRKWCAVRQDKVA